MARQAGETGETGRTRGSAPAPGVLRTGTPVYDVAGKKVGTVVMARLKEGYVEMRRGWLASRIVYVPLGAIEQTGPRALYLRLPKGEVRQQGWDRPPPGPTLVYERPARQMGRPQTPQGHHEHQLEHEEEQEP